MAEEDNRKIRDHLGDIEPFQIPTKPFASIFWPGRVIGDRTLPSKVDHWAMLRTFQPIVTSYHLNVTQDRICSGGPDTWDELWYQMSSYSMTTVAANIESFLAHNMIDATRITTETTVVSVSQATGTLTGAANTNEKVLGVLTKNSTRAPTATLDFTPSGGTAAQILDSGANAGPQGVSIALLGGVTSNGVTGCFHAITNPLNIQAGDVLLITQTNFVAADVVEHAFISEVYSV